MVLRSLPALIKNHPWRVAVFILIVLPMVLMWSKLRSDGSMRTRRDEPIQELLSPGQTVLVEHEGWTLRPLARIKMKARVLSVKRYEDSDAVQLAPVDLALGWGKMAEDEVLEWLEISQSDRQYHWKWWGAAPLPEEELIRHSTNAHLIPVNEKMRRQIEQVKKGDWIELKGELVEAMHPRADKPWRSSLVRDDRGDGACEIIYVRSLQHISGRSGNL